MTGLDTNNYDLLFEFTMLECQGCDCIFRQPDTVEYIRRFHQKLRKYYVVKQVTPHCDKSKTIGEFRWSIYQRAFAAKDDAFEKYKTQARINKAFDDVADEWRNWKCTYYEPHE